MIVNLGVPVTAMIESFAGRPARWAGTFFRTVSIACALVSFLICFGIVSSIKLLVYAHGLLAQKLVQERLHAAERVHPPAMQQRFVRVVRKDDELVVDVARAQQLDEAGRLLERHVAV